MAKIECALNGTYRGVIEIKPTADEIEFIVNCLEEGENTCTSFDRKKVYNSAMTPLYSNGGIFLAEKIGGKIYRDYTYPVTPL